MQLATIDDTDRTEARKLYLEYRAAAKDQPGAELEAIAAGYRALSLGQAVISLRDTLIAGGIVQVMSKPRSPSTEPKPMILPALAVAPATDRWCWLYQHGWGETPPVFVREESPHHFARRIPVPAELGCRLLSWGSNARAMVPIVPPRFRPAALHRYFVLWEAEWEAVVPKDPTLLKHIRGDLYAVVATWDLTELERAVLGARLATPS